MEFTFREGHIKLWYTGRQCRKLIMAPEKLEFPSTIRQIVIHCRANNIEENSLNDIANGLLCSALIIKKRNSITNIYITGLLHGDFRETSKRNKIKKVNKLVRENVHQFQHYR